MNDPLTSRERKEIKQKFHKKLKKKPNYPKLEQVFSLFFAKLFLLVVSTLGAILILLFFVEPRFSTMFGWSRGTYNVSFLISFAWSLSLFFFLPNLIKDYLTERKKDNFTFWKFFISQLTSISYVIFSVVSFFFVASIRI